MNLADCCAQSVVGPSSLRGCFAVPDSTIRHVSGVYRSKHGFPRIGGRHRAAKDSPLDVKTGRKLSATVRRDAAWARDAGDAAAAWTVLNKKRRG